MAAIRVYELARDLNMTNKVLLDKIRDMDISVKSHMSSLDEEAVARIKANLFGTKEETIIETRIKPTVIRRRREQVEAAPPAEPEAPLEDEVDETVEATTAEPVDTPEAEEIAAADEITEAETTEEQATAETSPEETTEEAAPSDEAAAAEEAEPKKPPRKRKKQEAAAKIIKLPIAPKQPPSEEQVADTARPAKTAAKFKPARPIPIKEEVPPAGEPAKDARKKKKKRTGEDDRDRRFTKKKAAFRRKEIVEGAALYGRGHRARKGKKGVKAKPGGYGQKTQITVAKAIKRRIKIDDTILLADLAKRMGIKAGEMIQVLMSMGVMATVNQTIDFDMAALVAAEFNYEVEKASFEEDTILKVEEDNPENMVERPPVVTIMGHVDHGKTSLLDVIRETKITDIEAGGITQHIGAYYVETEKGRIAFLDTPGHEAFTAMRGRGAKVTDIVVLVVAADDGVMPQTTEAVNHARAADVPIIVAVNKIDKDNADPERVYRELSEQELTPEEWGGDTIFVKVSAKQKSGISELLEMILLQAEVLELKANPDKLATGYVVESKIDPGRGAVATVLVQEGTLKVGDAVVCGVYHGKVRAMLDDQGNLMETAGPSIPVEVVGLSGVPFSGDQLVALDDEKNAKQISEHRIQKQRSKELAKSSRLSLDKLYEKMQEGEVKDLNLIIRADVHGSIEALADSLTKLSNEEVQINIVQSATGTITESDISLASVLDAIIIGFNVRPTSKVTAMAHEEGVEMRFYNVIYNVIKEVKDAIAGMMASTYEEKSLGRAEVREVFHVPKIGAIAGCYVTEGKIARGRLMRVIRDGIVDYESKVSSLRRFKDDVKDVQSGYECGIGIENYNDIKVGDVLECYYLEEIKPEL